MRIIRAASGENARDGNNSEKSWDDVKLDMIEAGLFVGKAGRELDQFASGFDSVQDPVLFPKEAVN